MWSEIGTLLDHKVHNILSLLVESVFTVLRVENYNIHSQAQDQPSRIGIMNAFPQVLTKGQGVDMLENKITEMRNSFWDYLHDLSNLNKYQGHSKQNAPN